MPSRPRRYTGKPHTAPSVCTPACVVTFIENTTVDPPTAFALRSMDTQCAADKYAGRGVLPTSPESNFGSVGHEKGLQRMYDARGVIFKASTVTSSCEPWTPSARVNDE